jgi:hypothetical protein
MARVLLLLLLALPARRAAAQTPAPCDTGTATAVLDANNVRASLYNNGALFWKGGGNLFNVPKAPPGRPMVPNAIFVASLHFGGYVGNELVQASADYHNWEYTPGPLDAAGRLPESCAPFDRIASVRLADVQALRRGTVTEAVRSWPHAWGAPVVDGDGVPGNYNLAGGDRPELLGTETHWWVMNAMGPHRRTGSKPFPLEMQVSAFAMPSLPGFGPFVPALDNSVVLRYRLVWHGAVPLTDAYLGFYVDPDLGNSSDDYVGSDTTLRMGFAYNADNFDEGSDGYGTPPPAVGLLALDGPPMHDDDRDGRPERPGFTSFLYYNGGTGLDGEPRGNTTDYYNYLRARWQDGRQIYACGNGHASLYASCGPTRWMWPGDPVTRAFWSEFRPSLSNPFNPNQPVTPNAPSDRRFVMGMGPLVFQPGAVQDFVFAFVWARGNDHLDSVSRLRGAASSVMDVWRTGGYAAHAQLTVSDTLVSARPTLAIGAVRPHPVRGPASVRLSLPVAAPVRVWVVDALGRTVARLHDGPMDAGPHALALDGAVLAPGAYAVRVALGGETVTRPFVVVG